MELDVSRMRVRKLNVMCESVLEARDHSCPQTRRDQLLEEPYLVVLAAANDIGSVRMVFGSSYLD